MGMKEADGEYTNVTYGVGWSISEEDAKLIGEALGTPWCMIPGSYIGFSQEEMDDIVGTLKRHRLMGE